MEFEVFTQSLTLLETLAMLSGVAGVWLTIRQNIWCFPVGMFNVGLYAWLFFSPGITLYADATLQVIYFILLGYGWYKWLHPEKTENELHPSFTSVKLFVQTGLIIIACTGLLGWFFSSYTNASLPWLDSSLTAISLAAQWMIARKKIENWILWICADLIYIPMYLHKDLPLTALLYFVFLVMAIQGWRSWRKDMKAQII